MVSGERLSSAGFELPVTFCEEQGRALAEGVKSFRSAIYVARCFNEPDRGVLLKSFLDAAYKQNSRLFPDGDPVRAKGFVGEFLERSIKAEEGREIGIQQSLSGF